MNSPGHLPQRASVPAVIDKTLSEAFPKFSPEYLERFAYTENEFEPFLRCSFFVVHRACIVTKSAHIQFCHRDGYQ